MSKRERKRIPVMAGKCSDLPCHDCRRPVRRMYMVIDSVWKAAWKKRPADPKKVWLASPDGIGWCANLHIGCLERRLGRRLTAKDFYSGH